MTRIGIITPFIDNYGGGEVFIDNLIRYGNTVQDDYCFMVFSSDNRVFSENLIKIPKINSYSLLVKNLNTVKRIIKENKIDVLILNDIFISQFSILFSNAARIIVSLIHGEIVQKNNDKSYTRLIISYLRSIMIYVGCNGVLSVNKRNIALYKNSKKVHYIGNFIIPNNAIQMRKNIEFDFIFVGRIIPLKNIQRMIEVFSIYKSKVDENSSLLIIGDGDEIDSIRNLITLKNLEKSVLLMGSMSHENVMQYYSKSGVLLLFSKTEGFPTVVLEALSCGLPCVVSNVGSNEDIIKNGVNGYIFDLKDENERIADLLEKAGRIDREECKKTVEHFYVDNFYSRLKNTLKQIESGKR